MPASSIRRPKAASCRAKTVDERQGGRAVDFVGVRISKSEEHVTSAKRRRAREAARRQKLGEGLPRPPRAALTRSVQASRVARALEKK